MVFIPNLFVEVKPSAARYADDMTVGKRYPLYIDEDGDLSFIDDVGDSRTLSRNKYELNVIQLDGDEVQSNNEDRENFQLEDLIATFEGTDAYLCIESRGMFFSFLDQEYLIETDEALHAAIKMVESYKELNK